MSTPKTIHLGEIGVQQRTREALAASAITPGMLVERLPADTFQAHSTALAGMLVMVAIEDNQQGNGIDVVYATGVRVFANAYGSGDLFFGLLDDGETVVIGDELESAGNGYVQKFTSGVVIGIARSAVDMSDSSSADPSPRIIVEVV